MRCKIVSDLAGANGRYSYEPSEDLVEARNEGKAKIPVRVEENST